MEHGLFKGAGEAILAMLGHFIWTIIIIIGPLYGIHQIIFGKSLRNRLIGLAIFGTIAAIEFKLYYRQESYATKIEARAHAIAELPRLADRSHLPDALLVEGGAEYDSPNLEDQAVALAESGSFDVWIWRSGTSQPQHILVGAFDDCASNSRPHFEFWALSALTRCGHKVNVKTLPERYLRFRTPRGNEAPLAPSPGESSRKDESYFSPDVHVFSRRELTLLEGTKETLIDYSESWSQPFFYKTTDKFYFGTTFVDPGSRQIEGATLFSGTTVDPISFILAATGKVIEPPRLVANGSAEADELAKQIETLLDQGTPKKEWLAHSTAWLLWSRLPIQAAQTKSLAARLVATESDALSMTNYIAPWECPSFDPLFEKRNLLIDACSQAARNLAGGTRGLSCHLPFTEAYTRFCRQPRDRLWIDGDIKGRKILLLDYTKSPVRTDAAISAWSNRSDDSFSRLHEIFVPDTAGKLDIVVHGSGIWAFTGSTNCVARITIASGSFAGIFGIDEALVETRNIQAVPERPIARFDGAPDLVLTNLNDSAKQLEGTAPAGSCGEPAKSIPRLVRPASGDNTADQPFVHIDAKSLVTSPDSVPFNVPVTAAPPQPPPVSPTPGLGTAGRMDL